MADVLVGLQTPVFGTIGDAQIIVDNIRETLDGETEELTDGDGDIVAAVFHGSKGEVTMDFTMKAGTATNYLKTRGSTITLPSGESNIAASKTLYLVSSEKVKTKGGFMTGTITCNYYPDMS